MGPLVELLPEVGDQEPAIRSRWQHDAVPPWRPVAPRLVCEVRVTNLDLVVAEHGPNGLSSKTRVSVTDD
jgi:hypothetical protein